MKRKLQRNLIAVLLVGLAAMLASLAIPAYGAWIVMAGLASELALIVENLRLSTGS
jgi:Tfp pilus assembly major pilin PilA